MTFIVEPLRLPGCLRLRPKDVWDRRGEFVKNFVQSDCLQLGLPTVFAEEFYSLSIKDTIRGMHLQVPPFQHDEFVYCMFGSIKTVLLDLRVQSPTYRQTEILEWERADRSILYFPAGIAHGYLVRSEEALVAYKRTSPYAPDCDKGVRWDSLGVDWGIADPIISERDANFPALEEYVSPFTGALDANRQVD